MADVKLFREYKSFAEHPFTERTIPVWIGDYVLAVTEQVRL
jgi:leucyl-tRNA synthetase